MSILDKPSVIDYIKMDKGGMADEKGNLQH